MKMEDSYIPYMSIVFLVSEMEKNDLYEERKRKSMKCCNV
jgi:hypothetical protein